MKIPRLRWLMISLIFLATVINYIDRQTVSVLKTAISTDLGPVERRLRRDPEQLPAAVRHQPDGVGPPLRPDRHAPRLRLLDRRLVRRRGGARRSRATAGHVQAVPRRARVRRGGQLARRGEGGRRVVPREGARPRHGHLQHRRGARRRRLAAHHRVAGARPTAGAPPSSSPGCWGSGGCVLWLAAVPGAREAPVDHRGRARAHPVGPRRQRRAARSTGGRAGARC